MTDVQTGPWQPPSVIPPRPYLPWTQHVVDRSLAGSHRIKITEPGGSAKDVTYFRNVPTEIQSYSFGDPFGPAVAEILFPQITVFDTLGTGRLSWLVAGANVDILWQDPFGELTTLWEGYITSLGFNSNEETSNVSVQCKGALFQADNYEAYPQWPSVPLPYEFMIKDALDPNTHPDLRTAPLLVSFPDNWDIVVPDLDHVPDYLKPYGVREGQNWTGITGRNTGSWNKSLTGQIQSLLALMFAKDGSQWTIMLNEGRQPELRLRRVHYEATNATLRVTVSQPGVQINITEDWTQAVNVYYGQGTDLSNVGFSNMVIANDGSRTSYRPFAALRQVHPASEKNPDYDPAVMRIEQKAQFDQGISHDQCVAVALNQLQRSAHPGWTGTVSLKMDPEQHGDTFSRFMIMPGMTMLLNGFRGMQTGLLVHIASVNVNVQEGSVECTVDSKYRDLLTIQEVRARTRDALVQLRSLRIGQFTPIIKDLRKPWSYFDGSGCIPGGIDGRNPSARDLFMSFASNNDTFPWTNLTKKYPPWKYPHFYIRVPPPSTNYTKNWATTWDHYAIPCNFSQGGTIRLTQMVALDRCGDIMPIRFHFSLYYASGVNPTGMPIVPEKGQRGWIQAVAGHEGQNYPFFPGAFETTRPDGGPLEEGVLTGGQSTDLVAGWGNYYQGAGFYPGLQSEGHAATGLLYDESPWNWDVTDKGIFVLDPAKDLPQNQNSGLLYAMIYAEALRDRNNVPQPVYFLGRAFIQEPYQQ